MKIPDRRFGAWIIALSALGLLPLLSGYTHIGWEVAEVSGLIGVLLCLWLVGCAVRARAMSPPILLSVRTHERIGWIAGAATALHIASGVLAERNVLEFLKPSTPLYQAAGIAAALLLLGLSLTSVDGARRRLFRSHRSFQATHVVMSCLLIVLLAAHVVATNRYTFGPARRILFVCAALGAVAMLLRSRNRIKSAPQEAHWQRRLVFGRHSTLLVSAIAGCAVCLAALVPSRSGSALQETAIARANALPLHFSHDSHAAVNCVDCHHNYVDGRGIDTCIHCHRDPLQDLKLGAEARFHDFCLGCHRAPPAGSPRHGPVSGCDECHRRENHTTS